MVEGGRAVVREHRNQGHSDRRRQHDRIAHRDRLRGEASRATGPHL